MNEQQLKILKFMTEVTGRVDMDAFSKKIGLSANQTIEQVKELAKTGFVAKTGGGYGITEKGRTALKAYLSVSSNERFHFYTAISEPTGVSAGSIKEFYDLAQTVNTVSLEFHLYRGDFENWIKTAANEPAFADELVGIKKTALKGESLRKTILAALKSHYGL